MQRSIRRLPLRDEVYERVKGLILRNELRPNQEIPIDQLAQEFGVSQTPVREALAKLELDGLIRTGRHKTPRVTGIVPQHVKNVYEVRMLLEGWAASVAAKKLTEDDLGKMARILNKTDEFHGLILRSVENELFSSLARLMVDHSVRIRSLVELRSAKYDPRTIREHRAILNALRSGSPARSRREMVNHLRLALRRTLQVLTTAR